MPAATKSPSTAPERSLTQRMDGAASARTTIRTKRAKLKHDLRAGKANPQALLLSPPEYVLTAKVSDMLLAVPKYGQVKVNKILASAGSLRARRSAACLPRQRAELVSYLRK